MENPYSAPKADLADLDEAARRGPRPAAVRTACRLFWITLAANVISLAPGVRREFWQNPEVTADALVVMAVVVAIMTAFSTWLILQAYRGRNWARWALIVLYIGGWVFVFTDTEALLAETHWVILLDLTTTVIEIYAVILLLGADASAWFKPKRA